jgi:hypothetical protein
MIAIIRRAAALAITLGLALSMASAGRTAAQPSIPPTIEQAYIYAFPIYETARVRYLATAAQPAERSALNHLVHARALADHNSRAVTTPNNDTLYSSASLDLSGSPAALDTPDFGDRYYSIAFMDAFTNNFVILGRRTTGGAPLHRLIVGPDWHGEVPPGVQLIRAPGNWIWVLVRILVQGPGDLPAVHALQDAIALKPVQPFTPAPPIKPVPGDAANFLAVVNQALAENPPPPADRAVLDQIAQVGVGPGAAAPEPALLATWQAAWPALQQRLVTLAQASQPTGVHNGWTYAATGVGDFGVDYDLRAIVALGGLAALPPAEAVYSRAVSDDAGGPLSSDSHYRFHIPPEGLPEDGFWSLSAYELQPDGRLFFADNAIHRYAVGDRTSGLIKNPDGSLDILIQHDAPTGDLAANWLPIPAGPVRLTLRVYQPRAAVLQGQYRFPALQKTP